MKGYRLHDERIAYSGGIGSMRSIKYELVDVDGVNGLRNEIASAIISDYRVLYGPLNFDEYIANKKITSLLDFWLRALSLGFVFSNQNSIESEFLGYLGKKTVWQKCYSGLSDELRNEVDEQKFCEFLLKAHRGVEKKSDEQRQRIIMNLLKKGADSKALEQIARNWSENFAIDNDELDFKCDIFNVKKPKLPKRAFSLSFAVDPSFEEIDFSDRTEFLDWIITFYEDKVGVTQAKRFLAIGDNGNYFNGLFGNLLTQLKNGKIFEMAEFLDETYGMGEVAVVTKRLEKLKKLADTIDAPKLTNQWSDYRSDFNGTIESWYSNRAAKQQATIEQLDGKIDKKTGEITGGLRVLLAKIEKALPESNAIKEGILAETIEFVRGHGKRVDRKYTDELESYLATLKTDLNDWQFKNEEAAEKLNKECKGWQKDLSKRIQSSPLFFSENKYALWDQLVNLKVLIKKEVEKLEGVLVEQKDDYEITDRQVDMLAQLYNRIKDDGNQEVIKRLKEIERELQINFSERTEKCRYFVSGFERTKVTKLDIKNTIRVSRLVKLARLNQMCDKLKTRPQDSYALRDTTQLSKIVVSAWVRGSDKEQQVVLIHSNLSGYASLISRARFVSRATVQAVNGSQINLGVKNNKYYYAFSSDRFEARSKVQLFGKTYNFSSNDIRDRPSLSPVLAVRSSKYQVQFLDWFMGLHSRKKTDLGAGGAFSIAEKTIRLDWSGETPSIAEVTDPRVFVSQPFEIKPRDKGRNTSESRFLGVDIGEYGLAWNLIEVNGDKVSQLEDGFIEDQQQKKLKVAVKNQRDHQVRATFTSPDTLIARIRESLIGSYRNQLEDLSMRKNARLCFEYEVSGFEAGGKRISKVYDSIKRGDIHKKDNNAQNKMAWGDRGVSNWGFETTAAGTSQTCSKCKRWASLSIEDGKRYEFLDYKDKLYKTKISDGDVRLLKKKNSKGEIKGKELKGLIYKAMRPNDEGLGMKIVERQLGTKKFNELMKKFGAGKSRGNMAIFVCPYVGCHHVSDADLQAALNIAIRGYFKQKTEGKIRTAAEFSEAIQDLNYSPVGLL